MVCATLAQGWVGSQDCFLSRTSDKYKNNHHSLVRNSILRTTCSGVNPKQHHKETSCSLLCASTFLLPSTLRTDGSNSECLTPEPSRSQSFTLSSACLSSLYTSLPSIWSCVCPCCLPSASVRVVCRPCHVDVRPARLLFRLSVLSALYVILDALRRVCLFVQSIFVCRLACRVVCVCMQCEMHIFLLTNGLEKLAHLFARASCRPMMSATGCNSYIHGSLSQAQIRVPSLKCGRLAARST